MKLEIIPLLTICNLFCIRIWNHSQSIKKFVRTHLHDVEYISIMKKNILNDNASVFINSGWILGALINSFIFILLYTSL